MEGVGDQKRNSAIQISYIKFSKNSPFQSGLSHNFRDFNSYILR